MRCKTSGSGIGRRAAAAAAACHKARLAAVFAAVASTVCAQGCCEREVETTGWLEVQPEAPCPPPADAEARFKDREGYFEEGEQLVSVDGAATREGGFAWTDCCYEVTGATFDGTERACVRFTDEVGPDPPTCPTAAEVLDELRDRGTPSQIAGAAEQVVAGPRVDASQPLIDRCGYPVTAMLSSDACG